MNGLKILVPLDSSKNSEKTIKTLFAMKDMMTCPITLLHVYDPERLSYNVGTLNSLEMFQELSEKAAATFLKEKASLFAQEGLNVTSLFKIGSPRKVICELADSGEFNLLLIGRHSEGELRSLLFGHVSNFVIHHVKCPVMII